MDDLMVAKAVFLLREARVPRQDAVQALGEYFPGVAFEDRMRCVQEASDLAHGWVPDGAAAPPGGADAWSFATADDPHRSREAWE